MALAIEMRGITKRFGETVANDGIDFAVEAGHIHAILGENGAGKTTLMHILYGEEQPDEGSIFLNGEPVDITSPAEAIRLGIGLIHQHFMLINEFTIPENFALGSEPTHYGIFSNYEPVRKRAAKILQDLDIPLSLDVPVGGFSVEEQQIIEVGKALYRDAEVLILDEPTSVLSPQKVEKLLDTLLRLKQEGKTLILITHKLEETLAVADTITVLRKGKHVATLPVAEATRDQLVSLMVGSESTASISQRTEQSGVPLLSVRDLSLRKRSRAALNHVSFEVQRGEIFGLTGVGGNGQAELVEALVGLRHADEGEIWLADKRIDGWDVRSRRRAGMAYVPEDRIHRGSALPLTIRENVIMGHHTSPPIAQGIRLRHDRARAMAAELIEKYGVIAHSTEAQAGSLSGGNLQKVIIAREFAFDADFLIAAYPSQGIDIRTTRFVHSELIRRRNQGCAILLVTGDLDEVLSLSDQIGVMYGGELVAVTTPEQTNRMELGQFMTGVRKGV